MAKKKQKRSPEQMHRQIQDSIQALPFAIEQEKKKGHGTRAFMLRWLSGPMLRVMNRVMNASRSRGKEGEKRRQTEQMRRHLDHRKQAMKQAQAQIQQMQKRRRGM